VGKPEGKRPLGRARHKWEDNIRIYLEEIVWKAVDWIDEAQDRDKWRSVVNTVMKHRIPSNAENLLIGVELLNSQVGF
jgi:hypothetical protein